jgi:hypothetical protein
MVCPMLGGQCVKHDCALWFQEIGQNGKPVTNMCGCAIAMTAQYLMEIRPEVQDIADGPMRRLFRNDGNQRSP